MKTRSKKFAQFSTTLSVSAFTFSACAMLLCNPALAKWEVDNDQSTFHFVTTKAGKAGIDAIQEVQSFKKISGKVEDDGDIEVTVDLTSVNTGIELRDQRIKEMLFNVVEHPKATFAGKVNIKEIKKLSQGAKKDLDLDGKMTIHNVSKPVTAKLRVVKLTGDQVLVETRAPLIVNMADFKLQTGVEAMRKIMALDVLPSSAPVSFSVVLKK